MTHSPDDVVRITGCLPNIQDQELWPAFLLLMIAETNIFVLTILKRYLEPVDRKGRTGRLFYTMYRDGTHFYAIVLAISVVNIFVMLLAPQELSTFVQTPLRVVHSSLCARVMLNIRKTAFSTSEIIWSDSEPAIEMERYPHRDRGQGSPPEDGIREG
ncbi:hypothetical protein C8Q80DRAFT_781989 [Daedaleopsis nitida]|nr:hypothetical protein C8Q80DRAFT_781989 [Daedaleopsis nitida]